MAHKSNVPVPQNEDDLYNHFLRDADDEYVFVIERSNKEDDRTFSQEALQDMRDNLFLFLGARIVAYWENTGKPAKKISAHVTVTLE